MRKYVLIALMALATPALAEDVAVDMVLGTTMTDVQSKLTDMGYEVRKAEEEEDKLEVYFVRDGQMQEVYVDKISGQVTKLMQK